MPNYDLDRLGEKEFERMCQSLLKAVIGAGTTTFGQGPDGAREATFRGKAPYPSIIEPWSGEWIFQVKFHDIQLIGIKKARQLILQDLKQELQKVVKKYQHSCNNYILLTNIPLSGNYRRGSQDRILQEVIPQFLEAIPHIHIWGADELNRLLEKHSEIRQSYAHFLTMGDVTAKLMEQEEGYHSNRLAKIIELYLYSSYQSGRYVHLNQAGGVEEGKLAIKTVYVDLEFESLSLDGNVFSTHSHKNIPHQTILQFLLHEESRKTVMMGGPGQGKSTVGQYLAQIHRSAFLNRLTEDFGSQEEFLHPMNSRIPFFIELKDYAEWLNQTEVARLEFYLAEQVKEKSGRIVTADDIQEILKNHPYFLILDGIDEVNQAELHHKMMVSIQVFLDQQENFFQADFLVLATSRPYGYDSFSFFSPQVYCHLQLKDLSSEKVLEYAQNWCQAKKLGSFDHKQILENIQHSLCDSHIQLLMNTPLQVTILLLIVLSGGIPPKQREALFGEYLEIIFKREKAKSKWIIQSEKQLLFALHQYLGYFLHHRSMGKEKVGSSFKEEEFQQEVERYLTHQDPFSSQEQRRKKVEQIVYEATTRLMLLVGLEKGRVGFELRSFQEFFAAAHLVDTAKDTQQRYQRFEAILHSAHWHNVALFFAGRVARNHSGEAPILLDSCKAFDEREPVKERVKGAWLCWEFVADRSFEPNQRLQRNAIDYSLSLLEQEQIIRPQAGMPMPLESLSRNDITFHLKTLLQDRFQRLKLPLIANYLDLYFRFLGCDTTLFNVLEEFLSLKNPRYNKIGLQKIVSFKLPLKQFEENIKRLGSSLSNDSFVSVFAELTYSNPEALQSCWKEIHFPQEKMEMLIQHLFTHFLAKDSPQTHPPQHFFFDLSTKQGQLWTLLSMHRLLVLWDFDDNDDFTSAPNFQTSSLLQSLREESLLPELRVLFWSAVLYQRVDFSSLMPELLSYYHNLSAPLASFLKNSVYRKNLWLWSWLKTPFPSQEQAQFFIQHRSAILRCFFLFESLRDQGERGYHQAKKIWLLKSSALKQFRKEKEEIQELESFDSLFLDQILEKIDHSLDQLLCEPIFQKTSLSLKESLLILQELSDSLFRGDVERFHRQTQKLLKITLLQHEKIQLKWRQLIKKLEKLKDVEFQRRNLEVDEALEIEENLETKKENLEKKSRLMNQSMANLCLFHLSTIEEQKELLLSLFSMLNRKKNLDFAFHSPPKMRGEQELSLFLNLAPFTWEASREARQGMISFLLAFCLDLAPPSKQLPTLNQETEFFQWEFVESLFFSDQEEEQVLGIQLLGLVQLQLGKEKTWILKEMQSCSSEREIQAWGFFLQIHSAISPSTYLEWLPFLIELLHFPLSESLDFSPLQSVALVIYHKYKTQQEEDRLLPEKKLGLPLQNV